MWIRQKTESGLCRIVLLEQRTDEMILQDGRQMRRYEHMAVGIAQKGLLEDKEYDLILHASLG